MNNKLQKLEWKLKDYRRFIVTLLILGSYFYMGAVINTYLEPSSNGNMLFFLTILSLITVVWLFHKQNQIKIKLEKNEHV